MITTSEWVEGARVEQLHTLICQHKGKLCDWPNLIYTDQRYYLTYSLDTEYKDFIANWQRINTPIVETNYKKSWLHILKSFLYRHF